MSRFMIRAADRHERVLVEPHLSRTFCASHQQRFQVRGAEQHSFQRRCSALGVQLFRGCC